MQFPFNNEIYQQKDGVAIGSPLGPLLADIFMAKLESTELKRFLDGCILYKRYMDDIFCVVDEELNMEKLLGDLNLAHDNIRFSYELESNNNFPFLMLRLQDWSMGLRKEKYSVSPHGLANAHILVVSSHCTKNET